MTVGEIIVLVFMLFVFWLGALCGALAGAMI
jgi:hypothetical protein